MSRIIGINPTQVYTSADFTAGYAPALGTVAEDNAGKQYVLCKATDTGPLSDGQVGFITAAWDFTLISTSNDAQGQRVGVAHAAATANTYLWVQIWGVSTVRVLASAVAQARLNTTGTAGALDDDGTATNFAVTGINITTTNGGATSAVAGYLNYPQLATVAL